MEQPRRPGRKRENLQGNGTGNPVLQIRVPRPLLEAIQARGGSSWARQVLQKAVNAEVYPVQRE